MDVYNIFTNLPGKWSFYRTLKHQTSGSSLGSVEGEAIFTSIQNNVLLYKEEGEFTNTFEKKLSSNREYLYIYNQEKDEIQKHFSENGKNIGSFYLLKFQKSDLQKIKSVIAYGEHLCINDDYKATYEFKNPENGQNFNPFKLKYEVTGPNKDYILETLYISIISPA